VTIKQSLNLEFGSAFFICVSFCSQKEKTKLVENKRKKTKLVEKKESNKIA
jgi:hypothetical protein